MTNATAVYGLVTNGTARRGWSSDEWAAVDRLVTNGTVVDLLVTPYSRCGHVQPYTRLGGQVRAKSRNHDTCNITVTSRSAPFLHDALFTKTRLEGQALAA